MQIVFCDTCGLRVPQADLDSHAAKRIEDNVVVCQKCTAKAVPQPVAAAAPAKKETVELRRPVLTAEAPHGKSTTRRTTRTLHAPASDSGRAPASAPNAVPTMALIWGGAAMILVISVFLLSGNSSKDSGKAQAADSPQQPVSQQRVSPDYGGQQTKPAQVNAVTPRDPEPAPSPRVEPRAVVTEQAKPPEQKLPDLPAPPKEPVREVVEKTEKPIQNEPAPAPVEATKTETAKPEPKVAEKASDIDDTEAKTKHTDKPVAAETKKPEPEPIAKTPTITPPKTAKPPAFVRGKPCDLFPPDRSSRAENIPDPRNGGKSMAMADKYDGWTWNCKDLQGYSVKDGVLSIDKQGIMILDQYPVLEYRLSFEVELSKNSGIGLLVGANGAIVNLMIVTDVACMSGTWDQGKTDNNVNGDVKLAKQHGIKDGWIPIQVSIHADSLDFVAGNKPAMNLKLSKASSMPQLGFMLLGTNKNNSPTCKIRKVILSAP